MASVKSLLANAKLTQINMIRSFCLGSSGILREADNEFELEGGARKEGNLAANAAVIRMVNF